MAWQRTIPFGYQMQNGEIRPHPQESASVRDIFARYLAGQSYLSIAEHLTEHGPRYHEHTPKWNKHMVKRILENQRYIGRNHFPKLVEESDFLAVRLQRSDRNTYKPCPACIEPVRAKAVCALCGAKMTRDTKAHGRARWTCSECGCAVKLADEVLCQRVNAQLRALAQAPHLLEDKPDPPIQISPDTRRIQNELTLAFNRGSESTEYMKMLMFAAASEHYAAIPDPTPRHELHQLRAQLESGMVGDHILDKLMEIAVQAVRIAPDKSVTLELTNGKILNHREEQTT